MEKLSILADKYICDNKRNEDFLRYCKTYCGWLPESFIDEKAFLACLESFNAR